MYVHPTGAKREWPFRVLGAARIRGLRTVAIVKLPVEPLPLLTADSSRRPTANPDRSGGKTMAAASPFPDGRTVEQPNTARYRCSMTDNATNPNPGLPAAKSATRPAITAALNHHRGTGVKHQPGQDTPGAAGREHILYEIKGGSLRSPPAPAAGGRKRPSSPALYGLGPRRIRMVQPRPLLVRLGALSLAARCCSCVAAAARAWVYGPRVPSVRVPRRSRDAGLIPKVVYAGCLIESLRHRLTRRRNGLTVCASSWGWSR